VRVFLAVVLISLAMVTGVVIGWQTWQRTGSVVAGIGVFLLINAFVWVRGSSTSPLTPGIAWVVARAAENAPTVTNAAEHASSDPDMLKWLLWANRIWWVTIIIAAVGGIVVSALTQANPTWAFWRGGSAIGKTVGLALFVLPLSAWVAGGVQLAPVDLRNALRGPMDDDDLDFIRRWERRQLLTGLIQGSSAIAVWVWLLEPSFEMMGL